MDEEAEEAVTPCLCGGHGGSIGGSTSSARAAEAIHPSVGVGGRGQTAEGGGGTVGGSIGSDRRGCINKVKHFT